MYLNNYNVAYSFLIKFLKCLKGHTFFSKTGFSISFEVEGECTETDGELGDIFMVSVV